MPGGFEQPRSSKKTKWKRQSWPVAQLSERVEDATSRRDFAPSGEVQREREPVPPPSSTSKKSKRKGKKRKNKQSQDAPDEDDVETTEQEAKVSPDEEVRATSNVADEASREKRARGKGKRKSGGGMFAFLGSSPPEQAAEAERSDPGSKSNGVGNGLGKSKAEPVSMAELSQEDDNKESRSGDGWNKPSGYRDNRADRKKKRRSRYEEIVESGRSGGESVVSFTSDRKLTW
jgi:hypothetical protein